MVGGNSSSARRSSLSRIRQLAEEAARRQMEREERLRRLGLEVEDLEAGQRFVRGNRCCIESAGRDVEEYEMTGGLLRP